MKLPVFSPRKVSRAIQQKLKPEMRSGKEIQAYYVLDGKKLFRITLLKEHAADAIRPGTLNKIIQSTRLTKLQFVELVECPMTGSAYEKLIRQKIADGTLR